MRSRQPYFTPDVVDIKLIYHTGVFKGADDDAAALPFRLTVNFSPPEGGGVMWALMHGGSEVVVVRSPTRDAIDTFITRNTFPTHPRFRWLVVEEQGKQVAEQRRAGW